MKRRVPHRRPRPRKLCPTGLRYYPDRIGALSTLARIQRIDSSRRPHIEARAYRCLVCDGWHLTSQDKRNKE